MRVCVFGLGEAGSEISADLADAGADVSAFDPAPVPTPEGVRRHGESSDAANGAQVVVGLTASGDALTALTQAIDDIPRGAIYSDWSTSPPILKKELGALAGGAGFGFVDVALMGTVPGKGLKTPALASGAVATTFSEMMSPLGMNVEVIGDEPGLAAERKLIRSVLMKGLAALISESMAAATAAGSSESVWQDIACQLSSADEAFVRRLVDGTEVHAARRLHEMEAARDLLAALGVEPIMTTATVGSLRRVVEAGAAMPRDPEVEPAKDQK